MDYDQALSQVGGDESLLQRMIGQFVECTARACTRMDGFVEKSEWESLRLEAHSLKGASGYVCCRELVQLCGALQDAATTKDADQSAKLVAEVSRCFAALSIESTT